jgi:hypothetical protein
MMMKPMTVEKETHVNSAGTETTYRVFDDTYYHGDTSYEMVKILHDLRQYDTRVRFHWGDIETGRDWGDDYGVKGRIGRSTGPVKIPILIHNRRSHGGGAILTDCIVKITATQGGRVIYQHPKYHKGD